MILAKRLRGRAIAAYLGGPGQRVRALTHAARARLRHEPEQLDFYFDLADPWSYLAAQAVERLIAAYQVPVQIHVVSAPASDVDPAPALRSRYALRDAAELAAYWDVAFVGRKELEAGVLRRVGAALVAERPAAEQLAAILELAALAWAGDAARLPPALGKYQQEAQVVIPTVLASNYEAMRKRGHYQGAMIAFAGEWYWGLDRLPLLEEALAAARGVAPVGVVAPRTEAERGPLRLAKGDGPVPVDLWFSFRSPYSYLALERIEEVLRPYPTTLRLRPVAPMVSRGVPLPSDKKMYIARDAKRCADRLGLPFGNLCDPLGQGIAHCLAIAHLAEQRGLALPFARSALRGIWAEARDVADYVDLRHIVERAGLAWDEAAAAIRAPEGADVAAANAAELGVIGLWGVPSMRAGDFVAWGQDRLPLLADRLRRHALAVAAEPTPPADAAS
ncbi:MAG: DsbA family protein [Kofleriaceae bacterium]